MSRAPTAPTVLLLAAALLAGAAGTLHAERAAERQRMVDEQIAARGVTNAAVLRAMGAVPRHAFVPRELQRAAYDDRPLPIGYGQTISQPYIVAYMSEVIAVTPESRVLEIGAGSGYHAAVLGAIAAEVYTIEIVPQLGAGARTRLQRLGIENVHVKVADGYHGWPENAPFDAVVVTAASAGLPPPLLEQLRAGGRMIIPVGQPFFTQQLMLVEKQEDGTVRTRSLMPVRFVPFVRAD